MKDEAPLLTKLTYPLSYMDYLHLCQISCLINKEKQVLCKLHLLIQCIVFVFCHTRFLRSSSKMLHEFTFDANLVSVRNLVICSLYIKFDKGFCF